MPDTTYTVTGSTSDSLSVKRIKTGAVIIYGRGDTLGDFKYFANHLKGEISSVYGLKIEVKNIERKEAFFNYLFNFSADYKIKELHILSHSIGGGLFLGYGGEEGSTSRINAYNNAARAGRNITYEEVRDAEIGAILSDDFLNPPIISKQNDINSKFASGAFIKLWGCNAGYENWPYSDDDWDEDGTPEIYWSMLNTKNVPKPSVSKAFAKYFNTKVYGAKSGSHVEVLDGDKWIKSEEYKKKYGKWANPAKIPHKLVPDSGPYYEYNP